MADLEQKVKGVLNQYGYSEIFLPIYEYYEILQDTAFGFDDENIIRFIDRHTGKSLVLRPDFTPQVCRFASNYMRSYPMPVRLSYSGRVFRNVNMDKGIKSEQYQVGCELFGTGEEAGDTELLLIAHRGLKSIGLEGCRIVLADSIFTKRAVGLTGADEKALADALGLKNKPAVKALCEDAAADVKKLMDYLPHAFGGREMLSELLEYASFDNELKHRIEYVIGLFDSLISLGISAEDLVFDASDTAGLAHYTGITFDILHSSIGFKVASGGRYDNLTKSFGMDTTACGMAFYVEELMSLKVSVDEKIEYDYLVFGKENLEKAEKLRDEGKSVFFSAEKSDAEAFRPYYDIENIID